MSNNKRFIVDTCGTLIDMETRDTFDYVSEVVDLLNRLVNEINTYDAGNQLLKRSFGECCKENEKLKKILSISEKDNVNDIVDVLNLQQNEIWKVKRENEQLKHQNELLEEELLQCKAVIDNRWKQYLDSRGLKE